MAWSKSESEYSFWVNGWSNDERNLLTRECVVFVVSTIGLNLGIVENCLWLLGRPYTRPKWADLTLRDWNSDSDISPLLSNLDRSVCRDENLVGVGSEESFLNLKGSEKRRRKKYNRCVSLQRYNYLCRVRYWQIDFEVLILTKLVIVSPATNAVSERSFSALKRLKSYLRSTTEDNRLNHLMVLHVHHDKMDRLDLKKVPNEFIAWK